MDKFDQRVSNWASKHTPIFGSPRTAFTTSDYIEGISEGAYAITVVVTPSGDNPGEWAWAKAKGLSVGVAAIALTEATVDFMEKETDRVRPNNQDDLSFPSAHAARASVCATLASRNLRYISMPDVARTCLRVGFTSLALASAWSRVEAKMHYPSDVLVGMALGHFFGAFLNDAFLGAEEPKFWFGVQSSNKDLVVSLNWFF